MSEMSFREKSAWISFVCIALFGLYLARIGHLISTRASSLHFFFMLVAVLVALEIVLHLVIRSQSPHEARTPKDERDRLIDLKATRVAFPVLLIGTFASIGTLHLDVGRFVMAHVMLFAIIIAELTRFGAQIVYYRRGA